MIKGIIGRLSDKMTSKPVTPPPSAIADCKVVCSSGGDFHGGRGSAITLTGYSISRIPLRYGILVSKKDIVDATISKFPKASSDATASLIDCLLLYLARTDLIVVVTKEAAINDDDLGITFPACFKIANKIIVHPIVYSFIDQELTGAMNKSQCW